MPRFDDDRMVLALRSACFAEAGRWASAAAVDRRLGRLNGSASQLNRLAREGRVRKWDPIGVGPSLFQVRR